VRIDPALLSPDDVTAAFDHELKNLSRRLPNDVTSSALASRRVDASGWVHARVSGSFLPTAEEVIAMSKSGHGVRPVAVWDFPSRILYGALTLRVANSLPTVARMSWRAFRREPLKQAGAYVISSDIAACYEYIDHELLVDELLIHSADHAVVESLAALLSETANRRYGLPQESWASDLLASAFLFRLERILVRRGLQVSRFSDDFRFTCKSWSDAVRALEIFSEEARRMGLAINDLKTVTWKRARYEASLDRADELRRRAAN
jgi:RNA-directed DNA polymerase